MSAADHLQGRLFDPATTRAQSPGERSFEQWESQPGVAYHGTFRHDWADAPTTHYGTKGVAAGVVESQADYLSTNRAARQRLYDPSLSEYDDDYGDDTPETDTHIEGRIFARRMPSAVRHVTDAGANSADMAYRLGEEDYHEVPRSIRDSSTEAMKIAVEHGEPAPDRHARDARFMEKGGALSYTNEIEPDRYSVGGRMNSTLSYVAPKHAVSSWEEDVINDPHASPMKKSFAWQRTKAGQEGQVAWPTRPEVINGESGLPFGTDRPAYRPIKVMSPARSSLRREIVPE